MHTIKTKSGLLKHFDSRSLGVKRYFEHVPKLVAAFPLDVTLAYVFSRVEQAQVMSLYCGIVKLHRVDGTLTWNVVHAHRLTRDGFTQKYEAIYGKALAKSTQATLSFAEGIRDQVMHGKSPVDYQIRNAIAHVLQYADDMNAETEALNGPRPFGDLRGFKGRAAALGKPTSRWVLRGMGFGA